MARLAQSYVGGNIYLRRGRRVATWYIRWRDGNGEHRRALGPDWTEKGKPPAGHFRKREAEQALQELLVKARAGEASRVRTGVTFKEAAEDWMRHGEIERGLKPTTIIDYRSALRAHLLPTFGTMRLEERDGTGHRRTPGAVASLGCIQTQCQQAARDYVRDL